MFHHLARLNAYDKSKVWSDIKGPVDKIGGRIDALARREKYIFVTMGLATAALLLLLVTANGEPQRQRQYLLPTTQRQLLNPQLAAAANYYNPIMSHYWLDDVNKNQAQHQQPNYYPTVYPTVTTDLDQLVYGSGQFIQHAGGRAALLSFTVSTVGPKFHFLICLFNCFKTFLVFSTPPQCWRQLLQLVPPAQQFSILVIITRDLLTNFN